MTKQGPAAPRMCAHISPRKKRWETELRSTGTRQGGSHPGSRELRAPAREAAWTTADCTGDRDAGPRDGDTGALAVQAPPPLDLGTQMTQCPTVLLPFKPGF